MRRRTQMLIVVCLVIACQVARGDDAIPNETLLPQIEVAAEPVSVEPGQASTIFWHVADAYEVLVLPTEEPLADLPWHDWEALIERGAEPVAANGERVVYPEETGSFALIAWNDVGIRATSIVLEVEGHPEDLPPGILWCGPELRDHERQDDGKSVAAGGVTEAKPGVAVKAAPPKVSLTVSPKTRYDNLSSTHTWSISSAQSIERGGATESTTLAPSTSSFSGTKRAGTSMGSGAAPPYAPAGGSEKVTVSYPPGGKARTEYHYVYAKNAAGATMAEQWSDVLSHPSFSAGCLKQHGHSGRTRKQAILAMLADMQIRLRKGCLRDNSGLDSTIPAFKSGHLNRTDVSHWMTLELQNLQNITFTCKDVPDAGWIPGRWADYSNTVILQWSPSHSPNLGPEIFHELSHKSGFNSWLTWDYSKKQIEKMASDVVKACYP